MFYSSSSLILNITPADSGERAKEVQLWLHDASNVSLYRHPKATFGSEQAALERFFVLRGEEWANRAEPGFR